jgi:integrase/recombinase XerD
LDRGGVQATLRQVAQDCGIKKRLPHTVYAIIRSTE